MMPDTPNPRTVQEIAAVNGVSIEEFRKTPEYAAGVRDGSIVDPPTTGPGADAPVPDRTTFESKTEFHEPGDPNDPGNTGESVVEMPTAPHAGDTTGDTTPDAAAPLAGEPVTADADADRPKRKK